MRFWNRQSTRTIELDGLLLMEVPAKWQVQRSKQFAEIVPPGDDGILQLSIYPRTTQADPSPDEARELLLTFLSQMSADASAIAQGDAAEATASVTITMEGTVYHWDVVAKSRRRVAVIASFCCASEDAVTRPAALTALASIQPLHPD